jgi:hypothetical protein
MFAATSVRPRFFLTKRAMPPPYSTRISRGVPLIPFAWCIVSNEGKYEEGKTSPASFQRLFPDFFFASGAAEFVGRGDLSESKNARVFACCTLVEAHSIHEGERITISVS